MESQPQSPEFRINPENFHLELGILSGLALSLDQNYLQKKTPNRF